MTSGCVQIGLKSWLKDGKWQESKLCFGWCNRPASAAKTCCFFHSDFQIFIGGRSVQSNDCTDAGECCLPQLVCTSMLSQKHTSIGCSLVVWEHWQQAAAKWPTNQQLMLITEWLLAGEEKCALKKTFCTVTSYNSNHMTQECMKMLK